MGSSVCRIFQNVFSLNDRPNTKVHKGFPEWTRYRLLQPAPDNTTVWVGGLLLQGCCSDVSLRRFPSLPTTGKANARKTHVWFVNWKRTDCKWNILKASTRGKQSCTYNLLAISGFHTRKAIVQTQTWSQNKCEPNLLGSQGTYPSSWIN